MYEISYVDSMLMESECLINKSLNAGEKKENFMALGKN
jgi:hypothetical protein